MNNYIYKNPLENGYKQFKLTRKQHNKLFKHIKFKWSLSPRIDLSRSDFNINDNWLIVKYLRPADDKLLIHQAWVVNICT